MIAWIKENIFTTEGRLNRLRYFLYTLLVSLVFGAFQVVAVWLAVKITGNDEGLLASACYTLGSLAMTVGNAMITVRRCHDLDKSGKWILLCLVPIVNVAFWLYLLFAKGTVGWNNFGPDPLLEQ